MTSHIDLPDDDPTVIDYLIQYLYHGGYCETFSFVLNLDSSNSEDIPATDKTNDKFETVRSKVSFKLHAQIYEIADKYDIQTLVHDAAIGFWNRARALNKVRGTALTEKGIEFLESIPTVYGTSSTAKGNNLRTLAASFMVAYGADLELCAQKSPKLAQLREETLRENPEFAIDVALGLMRRPTPVCSTCADEGLEAHGYKLGDMKCTACKGKGVLVCRINGGELGKA